MGMKIHMAPVGTNPMEQPELYKKARIGKIKLVLAILALLLVATLLCVVPVMLLTRPKTAAAAAVTEAIISSSTPTKPGAATGSPTPTASSTPTLAASPTRAATQTPWVITQIVTKVFVTQQVIQLPGGVVEKHYVTVVPVVITQIIEITSTPAATQTPWIITVEVTPTFTASPTPTETATETPTVTPDSNFVVDLPTETPSPTPSATP